MLRKVSLWKPTLSLLKLREESSAKGIKKFLSKEDILEKLATLEKNQKMLVDDQSEANDKLPHKFLSRAYVYSEIFKRNPDYLVTKHVAKQELIKNLSSLLLDERSFGAKSLRKLLRINENEEDFNIREIINVLEGLQDPLTISSIDLNILLNCDDNALTPIWNIIVKNVKNLSFKDVKIVLFSASTTQNIFNKRFMHGEEKVSTEILNQLLSQAMEHIKDSTALDCALLLKLSKTLTMSHSPLTKIAERLQQTMLEKYEVGNTLEPISVSLIAESLPTGCYSGNQEKVNDIVRKLSQNLNEIYHEQLIYTVLGIDKAGCKVPLECFIALDKVSLEDMSKVHHRTLFELVELAIKGGVLSEALSTYTLTR